MANSVFTNVLGENMAVHVRNEDGDGEDAVLADKDVVDDYALRRARLNGAAVRGHLWRTRPERNTLTYLAMGAALALVALLIVGVVAFVRAQLAQRDQAPTPRAATTQAVADTYGVPAAVVGVDAGL